MAVFNEILVGRYNRFVQKLFDMKGPASLTQLRGELGLEISCFHGVENRYLEGWSLFNQFLSLGASVGNPGKFLIRNPLGSNVIAVVSRITSSSAAQSEQWTINSLFSTAGTNVTGFAGESSTSEVDPRGGKQGLGRSATCLLSSNNANVAFVAGAINNMRFVRSVSALAGNGVSTDVLPDEMPLLPGMGLGVTSQGTNLVTDCNWFWRERFLEDSERA